MKFSQFLVGRRVFVKRVASVCSSIGIAVSLAACSSQGFSLSDNGYGRDGRHGSIPIPSEPVYGYPDRTGAAGSPYGAPFRSAAVEEHSQPVIQRTSLAPVGTASYESAGDASLIGASFAMQPVDGDDAGGTGAHYRAKGASAQRYAQAAHGYEDYRPYRSPYASSTYEPSDSDDDHNGNYVVVEGDTLYGVAKRFGLSTIELAELNGITGSTIYVGQHLRVGGAPKYTGTSRHYNGSGDHDAGPAYEENGDADEDRKSPPSYYRAGEGRRYTSYADYAPQRTGARAYGDDDYRSSRANPAKRHHGYADERHARRYEGPSDHGRDDRDGHHYKKPGGADYSYSVRVGDSLYEIARRNGLSHRELADYNDIPVSATLYPGQVLLIPKERSYDWGRKHDNGDDDDRDRRYYRRGEDENGYSRRVPYSQDSTGAKRGEQGERRLAQKKTAPKREAPKPVAEDAKPDVQPTPASSPESKPEPILAAHREIAADRNSADAGPADTKDCQGLLAQPVARAATTFREPVQGLIVAKFGSRQDGSFNDGIDFSVPKGTPVKAAENGVVAYVGNELPGFGNLILVRHADGFVTAYAHNDEVLVRRCEVVKRGQMISKAGATGKVTKPLLHFELRKDSKAVDPEAFFSRS